MTPRGRDLKSCPDSTFDSAAQLNLTRLVEVVGFVLSHVTTGSDSRVFVNVLETSNAPSEFRCKVSRPGILAPVAGILIDLQVAEKSGDGRKRLKMNLPDGRYNALCAQLVISDFLNLPIR